MRCHGQEMDPRRNTMLIEAEPLQAACEVKTAGRHQEFQTSRRLLLGGSIAAMTVGAGLGLSLDGNKRVSFIARARGQGTPASPPIAKAPQTLDYPGKDKGLVVLGDRPL